VQLNATQLGIANIRKHNSPFGNSLPLSTTKRRRGHIRLPSRGYHRKFISVTYPVEWNPLWVVCASCNLYILIV